MQLAEFFSFVRVSFAMLSKQYGLKELANYDSYAYKYIIFSNRNTAIRFDFDIRDGYLDVFYSDASIYNSDGSYAEPAIQSFTLRKSVGALIWPEGVSWPDREGGLFDEGVLEKALLDLIEGIARHSEDIFKRAGGPNRE